MAVVPSRFDQNPTQVRIGALADRAATALGAAGAFGGNEASVAHDRAGTLEAAEGTELGGESDGSDLCNAAQSLQSVNDGLEMRWGRLNGAVDRGFEPFDALGLMVDLHDMVEQDDVLLGV